MNSLSMQLRIAAGSLMLWTELLVILFIFLLIRYLQLGKSRAARFRILALLLSVLLLTQQEAVWLRDRLLFENSRQVLLLFVLSGLSVLGIYLLNGIGQWKQEHVSVASVKEAFDYLTAGCCYSLPSGIPKLLNHTMQEISKELTGAPVSDANEFWDLIRSGRLPQAVRTAEPAENAQAGTASAASEETEAPVLMMKSGAVYSFRKGLVQTEEGVCRELIASNITREYRLTKELQEKQALAQIVNTRLKALLGTIRYVTMNRELWQIKAALHDNLGQSLLYARRYLTKPGSVNKEKMLALWKENLRHLQAEEPEPWQLPYYVTGRQADQLGVTIELDGRLPQEEQLLPVIDLAVSTHVLNVLRHAGGRTAGIRVTEDEKRYFLRFTNDGLQPGSGTVIRERGGLSNLRRETEAVGGTMEIRTKNGFELLISLPKQL